MPLPIGHCVPLLALILAGIFSALPAGAGENYALLVAVGDYDRTELKPLKYTRADIRDLRAALLASGFKAANVVLLQDDPAEVKNTRFLSLAANIREELGLLLGGLEKDDSLIVAFAGHGVQFKGESESWFCPRDARLSRRETLVSFSDVLKAMDRCRASRKLLLADACRNDPQSAIARSRAEVDLESVTRPQDVEVPKSLLALFSCGPGQQSFEDPDLGHGVFFHHVLKGWNGAADGNKDGRLEFGELETYVRRETKEYARLQLKSLQTPQLKGELSDEWVLRRIAPPPATSATAKPAPPAAVPVPAPAPKVVDVSGRFHSVKYGWLVLTQRGNQVTAEMTYNNGNKGTGTGTVSGRTVELRWSNGADGGTAQLILSADAKELAGYWVGKSSRDDWKLLRK